MIRFAANLSMMYTEYPFLERFAPAAEDGFRGIEYLFPYDHAAADLRSRLDETGLTQALFNAPPGDWDAGERGLAAIPGRDADFARSVETALAYASEIGNSERCTSWRASVAPGADRARYRETYVGRLAVAAREAAAHGITIVIEPINTRDMPGYFLNRQDDAQAIRADVGADNLKVQFDCYHAQIVEGDLATKLRRDMPHIGHIQVAGVPERHEPDTGEINYTYLYDVIDSAGYAGWIGCEYRPRGLTREGLDWLKPWL